MELFQWILFILAVSGISVYALYLLYKYVQISTIYNKHISEGTYTRFDITHEYYRYLNRIHPYMYRIKLPSSSHKVMSKIHFINTYLKYIRDPTKDETNILMKKCMIVDKILNEYKLHVLKKIQWKFKISHPELEMGFPYTIGNWIVIPSNMIGDVTVETLLHEKIHIYQRMFPTDVSHIYEAMFPFAHQIDKNIISIPEEILQTKMTNPDENGEVWIYHYKGRWYYPSLQLGVRKRTEQIGFQVDVGQRPMKIIPYKTIALKDMNMFESYPTHISVYHPHEIFACILANHLIDGKPLSKHLEKQLNMEPL